VFFIVSPFAYGEQGFALHPPETFLEKGSWNSKELYPIFMGTR
jgi:hypothetical protein